MRQTQIFLERILTASSEEELNSIETEWANYVLQKWTLVATNVTPRGGNYALYAHPKNSSFKIIIHLDDNEIVGFYFSGGYFPHPREVKRAKQILELMG